MTTITPVVQRNAYDAAMENFDHAADAVAARQILADAQAEQLDSGETIHHER